MDDAIVRILAIAGTLTVAAIAAAFTWRAVSKPRLRLVYDEEHQRWTTTRRDVIQYVVSIPFLIIVWETFFLLLLLLLPSYDAEKLIFVPTGFVIAIRVLAHIWREPAVEFAKMVPIVVVTSAILMVQLPRFDDVYQVIDRYAQLAQDVDATLALVIALAVEFSAAVAWFLIGVRRRAPRGHNVPGIPWQEYPQADWMRQRARSSPLTPGQSATVATSPPEPPGLGSKGPAAADDSRNADASTDGG